MSWKLYKLQKKTKYEKAELAKVCKELMHLGPNLINFVSNILIPAVQLPKLVQKNQNNIATTWKKLKPLAKKCQIQFVSVEKEKKEMKSQVK